MGLWIWLEAYFQEDIGKLGHTSRPLAGAYEYIFGSIWGCPNAPKQQKKTIFWLFWTISLTRMGLLIWLGAHFQAKTLGHTSRPLTGLCLSFWSIWGCPNAPNSIKKTIFRLFWTISPTRMGLLIWLRAFFQAKILGYTSCPLASL
jgi:hypothetical protein